MVQDQGLNVYLAPARDFTRPYPQLVSREGTSSFTDDPNEVYIEAVDNERFVVIVDLLPDFDFMGAKNLRFLCELDDSQGTTGCAGLGDLEDFESRVPEDSGLMGRHLFTEMTRKVDGKWSDCAITFGRLETDEEMRLTNAEIAYAVETLGRVVVTVFRGNRKNSRSALWKGHNTPDIETSSTKIVRDNGVSHAIKHKVIRKSTQPKEDDPDRQWASLKGKNGWGIKFTIRYRSRDALEKIGVIPVARMDVDLTADSLPSSPNVKLEGDVDEDDHSRTLPLGGFYEDDRSPTQHFNGSSSPDAAEKASDGTKIKRERDI